MDTRLPRQYTDYSGSATTTGLLMATSSASTRIYDTFYNLSGLRKKYAAILMMGKWSSKTGSLIQGQNIIYGQKCLLKVRYVILWTSNKTLINKWRFIFRIIFIRENVFNFDLDIYLTINADSVVDKGCKKKITKKSHLFYPIILAYLCSNYGNQANN